MHEFPRKIRIALVRPKNAWQRCAHRTERLIFRGFRSAPAGGSTPGSSENRAARRMVRREWVGLVRRLVPEGPRTSAPRHGRPGGRRLRPAKAGVEAGMSESKRMTKSAI